MSFSHSLNQHFRAGYSGPSTSLDPGNLLCRSLATFEVIVKTDETHRPLVWAPKSGTLIYPLCTIPEYGPILQTPKKKQVRAQISGPYFESMNCQLSSLTSNEDDAPSCFQSPRKYQHRLGVLIARNRGTSRILHLTTL